MRVRANRAPANNPPPLLVQTVSFGAIVHTPGKLALLEKHRPAAEVMLWPGSVDPCMEEILRARFPKLKIAKDKTARSAL